MTNRRLRVLLLCGACAVIVITVITMGAFRLRELSRRAVCGGNMQAIRTAMNIYGSTYSDLGPPPYTRLVEQGYLASEVLICPSADLSRSNYVCASVFDKLTTRDNAVVMFEPKSNHGGVGGNVLFGDGHAAFVRSPRYERLIGGLPHKDP